MNVSNNANNKPPLKLSVEVLYPVCMWSKCFNDAGILSFYIEKYYSY